MGIGLTNWSGTHEYGAAALHTPASLDELRSIVAKAAKIHALGTRHCFNDIADTAELISLEKMDSDLEIDRDAGTVTVNAGIPYGDLALTLEREQLALHNMASLPHISVGGAIATATHGSGDRSGNLATAVAALELVTAAGDVLRVARGDDLFNGMVVNIGALGVMTRLTLDVQPTYLMRQQVFTHLSWEVLDEQFEQVMSSSDSVSLFLDYGDDINQVWLKSRLGTEPHPAVLEDLLGANAASRDLHPVEALSAEVCTEQLGLPGPWLDRLPHFRRDAVPASGAEVQAEYMVPRASAVDAIRAVRGLAGRIQPLLLTSEIRTVAADELWLSSAYGKDTVCIHFSLKRELSAVYSVLPEVEAALAPFQARPHWGKLFTVTASDLEPRYPRFEDFRQLAGQLDPTGKFRNDFLDRHVFG